MHDVTAAPGIQQIAGGHARLQPILATVQRALGQVEAPVETQPQRILKDSVGRKAIDQSTGSGARCDFEHLLLVDQQRLTHAVADSPGDISQRHRREHNQ